nr:uncharacterized protein LOC129162873 [Nothobranchius furzeri]XP_054595115.1 uncharacterized protein LOC129162874 [Nothobranchius furzeri]
MATGGPHEGNMEVFSDIYKAELDQRNELLQRELRDLEVKKLVFGNQERDFEQRVDAFEKNIARIRESLQEERQKLETKTQYLEKRERHFEDQQKKLTNHVDELKTNSQKGRDNLVSTQLLDEHRVKIELENRELQKQRQEIQDEWNKIKETQIANCEIAKNLNKTQEKVGDLWKALQVSKERSREEINNLKRDLERQKLEFIESKKQTERELTAEKQTLCDEKERLNAGKITLQNQIVEFQTESEQIRQILLKDKLDVQLLRENLQEDKLDFMKTAEGFQKDLNESLQDLKEKLEFLSLEKRSLEEEKQRFLMTKSESGKEQGRIYKILQEELDNLHSGKQSLETQVTDFREEMFSWSPVADVLNSKITANTLENELKKERHTYHLTKTQLENISSEIEKKFKQNETRLQKDLDCMKELRDKFEADLSAKQQLEYFEEKPNLEIQAHSETKIQTKEIVEKLRAEKDTLQIRADRQMSLLKENFDKKETELQNALENIRELNNKYNDVVTNKLKAYHLEQEQTQFQEDSNSYATSVASDITKRLAKESQMEIWEKLEVQAEENPVALLTKMSTLLNQSPLHDPSQVPGAIATRLSVITSVSATRSQNSFFYGNQRNKQCLPNSLVFLSFLHENENINSSDLDLVLDKGDRMYSQVRLAHPARDHLATDELPTEVKARFTLYHVKMNFANSKCGVFLSGNLPNLSQGLQCLTSDVEYALMVMGSTCIAIFRTQSGEFGYFDPHPRNTYGDPVGDCAVMLKFTCLTDMIDRITSVYTTIGVSPSDYYEIQPVEF